MHNNTASPLQVNEFCTKTTFISPVCSKSKKISLGTQLIQLAIEYCTVRFKMFYFLCMFYMYYSCEMYYKPITLQYYIADCVSWVPRLTLLDI